MLMPAHSAAVGTEPIFPWRSFKARARYVHDWLTIEDFYGLNYRRNPYA